MKVKVKLFSVGGIPASDGSIIPRHVIEEYLASDKYRADIAGKKMLGSLTHRVRNWSTQSKYTPAIAKTAGKDDQLLTVGVASPTHYIDRMWIEDSDQWVYVEATLLDEAGMDDEAIQNIKRLKGMLNQGIKPGASAVILGYWDNSNGHDQLKRLVSLKGFDITLNPSWKDAGVTEIYDDLDNRIDDDEREFSVTPLQKRNPCLVRAKAFSDPSVLGNYARSSQIDGIFTTLKAKEFSVDSVVESQDFGEYKIDEPVQKQYSAATLKERLRYAKLSPRMRFRRLFMDYRQLVKQLGNKMDPETERILKSLFATDCLDIVKTISPEVLQGKQINTLIGASSLGKNVRVAAQKLQVPYRLAMQEANKQGFVSKNRYMKIQEAYGEFIQSMVDEVFGQNSTLPENLTTEEGEEGAENV